MNPVVIFFAETVVHFWVEAGGSFPRRRDQACGVAGPVLHAVSENTLSDEGRRAADGGFLVEPVVVWYTIRLADFLDPWNRPCRSGFWFWGCTWSASSTSRCIGPPLVEGYVYGARVVHVVGVGIVHNLRR